MPLGLLISDTLAVFFAFYVAYFLRIKSGLFPHSPVPFSLYVQLILLTLFLTIIIFFHGQHYRQKRGFFSQYEFFSLARSYAVVFIVVMAVTFLIKGFIFSRLIILFAFFFSILFTAFFRSLYRTLVKKPEKHVLVIGNTPMGQRLAKKIRQTPELVYSLVATLPSLRDLPKYAPTIDIVFLATEQRPPNLLEIVERYEHITFKIVSDYTDLLIRPVNFDEFSDIPLIELKDRDSRNFYIFSKRLLDILVSLLLLVVLSPFFSLLALLIKATSKGSAIITQKRIGYHQIPFTFYKFRTMYISPQLNHQLINETDYLFKKKHDPRVTPFGKVLRRFCLDELPQLYNVFKGDMSLVGPRPHFAHEMSHLQKFQRKRFLVRPGMTGLWQISGRHDLSFERTIYLDIYYVKHISFLLDLEILFKTIPAILFSRGYW